MRTLLKKIFKPLANTFYKTTWIYRGYHSVMAYSAAALAGFPGFKLTAIGITGTNGKSTTTYLTAQILRHAGLSVGMVNTVNYWVGDQENFNNTKLTSLGPEAIQNLLARMVAAGNKILVIEVSSHGVKQNRIAGIPFTAAVLTNITHDHLDYHQNIAEYVHYKEKLFSHLHPRGGFPSVIAVNSKSEYANRFASHPANQKIFYAHDAALHATNLTATSQGSSFDLVFPDQSVHPVQLNLPGDFNVENALAAAAVCYGLGITPHIIADGLTSARPVPGRMENLSPHKPFNIIVDYAHTPDGFEKALSAARSWTSGRLIPVFGAAGNRLDRSHDHSKRPLLAAVAAKYADHIILTEEDPGIENPAEIIEEIQAGIPPHFNPTHITTILNRKDAIRHAISQAQSGDTIILLAMGAQTTMATKEGQIPYNEREFVRSLVQPDVIN